MDYLHLGDRIFLFDEAHTGYVGVQGFADTQLGMHVQGGGRSFPKEANTPQEFAQQHIFCVQPQQQHNALKHMHAFLEREGLTEDTARSEPRFRRLQEEAKREEQLNLQVSRRTQPD